MLFFLSTSQADDDIGPGYPYSRYEHSRHGGDITRGGGEIDNFDIVVVAEPELLVSPCAKAGGSLVAKLLQIQTSLLDPEF